MNRINVGISWDAVSGKGKKDRRAYLLNLSVASVNRSRDEFGSKLNRKERRRS